MSKTNALKLTDRATRPFSKRTAPSRLVAVLSLSGALAASSGLLVPVEAATAGPSAKSRPAVTPPNVVYPLAGATALRMTTTSTMPNDPSLNSTSTEATPPAEPTATPTDDATPTDTATPSDVVTETSATPAPVMATASPMGVNIATKCGADVVASTPGIIEIDKDVAWAGGRLVRVVTEGRDDLTTVYGSMRDLTVKAGDVVLSGEVIGHAGAAGADPTCKVGKPANLYFHVSNDATTDPEPRAWLATHAGKPVPSGYLFGNKGFNVATFNVLGASHRGNYATRLRAALAVFKRAKVDFVGLQEFQKPQRQLFLQTARSTYGIYPVAADSDSDNSVIWRADTFDFVEGGTIGVPYFRGNIRRMPWVKLRFKDGGRYPALAGREVYFFNVHNPATVRQFRDSARWRAKAIRIEIDFIKKLRETGLPVFFTGDFNDKQKAYCPLTVQANLVSPLGGSESNSCDYPKARTYIDWIFVAGDATFSRFNVDETVRRHISDHAFLLSRAHLAE